MRATQWLSDAVDIQVTRFAGFAESPGSPPLSAAGRV